MARNTIPASALDDTFLRLLQHGMVIPLTRAEIAQCARTDGINGWLQRQRIDPTRVEIVYVAPMTGPVAALVGVPRGARPAPSAEPAGESEAT